MTPLRRRMIEDMNLAGLSQGTQKEYIRMVSAFAQQFGCSPERIEEELVRIYFLDLRDNKKVALGTFQVPYSALKFLYQTTLNYGGCPGFLRLRRVFGLRSWLLSPRSP
ncbi:MAG: phage integrase N-terminal SAM-like domain-containing protein [Candidatus Omnitrophota bacterium]